jgi:hypothetical protein
VLILALRIAIAWTAISLLCLALWVVSLELSRRLGGDKARKSHPKTAIELHTPDRSLQAPRPIDTSTQTLSEKEVEALLATPAASDPIGIDGTSGRVREPKVAR